MKVILCLAQVSLLSAALWLPFPAPAAEPQNLVANGSFELDSAGRGVPDGWAAAGADDVKQRLLTDTGRDGHRCAKLVCTQMGKDSPAGHAMICQVGQVSVRRGRRYRLTCWAKGEGLQGGAIQVALNGTQPWRGVGLADSFSVTAQWERFEFLFRATEDLAAKVSRLQFWHHSTGTLWLDDVVLSESSEGPQWHPQIVTDGTMNFVPNSSFECGPANWGSYHSEPGGWGNHLYRLEGELDRGGAQGQQCWKIALTPKTAPVYYFDYFDAVRHPTRQILVANQGWFRVIPGEKLTLSAFLRADAGGVPARLAAVPCEGLAPSRDVSVGTEWRRYEFTFTPTQPFCFVAVGLNLVGSQRDAATLWMDAIQLQRGDRATDYAPRQAVESFLETGQAGNIFTNPAAGFAATVRAVNNTDTPRTLVGRWLVTDFADRTVFTTNQTLALPAHARASATIAGLCRGQRGFFRVAWQSDSGSNSIRCAVLEPTPAGESPLGMNHAYPWDYLLQLAHLAGISCWRDWSAKWHVVEPQKGRFDFADPDVQIQRVLDQGGQPLILLPFPSSTWSTSYQPGPDKDAGRTDYPARRKPIAYAPKDLIDFGHYAAAVVNRYKDRVHAFQVLNEPIYTDYALPRNYGYGLDDYLRLTETAHRAIKAADPTCTVVGGIGTGPGADLSHEFVKRGGLRFVDVFDLHIYAPAAPADSQEEVFADLEKLMREHGGPRPIWITEYGCYADDDPACVPQAVGDAAMNRCRWRSERAAAEHIVKFTAVTFAHGVRKIYFHAGTCGQINSPDAGGIFFEYGGTPRKMYAAAAALTRLLGTPDECMGVIAGQDAQAYLFRVGSRCVAIVWAKDGHEKTITWPSDCHSFDVMGNSIESTVPMTSSPIYVVAQSGQAQSIRDALGRAQRSK